MKFKFIEIPRIPRLAWCARIGADQEIIRVIHGPGVEVRDDWFFEGAWDGSFSNPGFVESTYCMGTGARIQNESVVFVSTSTPFRGLVTLKTPEQGFVSNSLPFLLAQAGDKPDIDYLDYYQELFFNFKRGFVHRPSPLRMHNGSKVYLHFCCNIQLTQNSVNKIPKFNPEAPSSYEDYRDRLVAMLVRLRENATDAHRKQDFEPLITLSRGYDSVACAALGAAAGWKKAVTLVPDDPNDEQIEDDGTPVAECLGLEIEKFDTQAWRQRTDIPEAEFVATSWGAVMVRFAGMENRLRNTLLIMGALGDTMWNPDSDGVRQNFSRPVKIETIGMGPVSHWEFQLRVGITTVFPPAYAAVHWDKIKQIMTSEEMQPWSIGGDYDRPLPRRIAEEMGVLRELFGQEKIAGAREFPHQTASKLGHDNYLKFLLRSGIENLDKDGKLSIEVRYVTPHFFHWGIRHTMRRYDVDIPED